MHAFAVLPFLLLGIRGVKEIDQVLLHFRVILFDDGKTHRHHRHAHRRTTAFASAWHRYSPAVL